MSNDFWAFSLATYATDGVAETCIRVQDEMNLDVNLVLYACWLASMGRTMTLSHCVEIEKRISEWRQRVVLPLRALRRDLRNFSKAASLRENIKALELQAERQQQDMMWDFFQSVQPLPVGPTRPLDNLMVLVDDIEANQGLLRVLSGRIAGTICD